MVTSIWPLWDVIFLQIPLISNNVVENSIPKVTILVIILISSPGPIPPLTDNIAAQLSHSRILHYSTINFLRNHAASPYSRGSKLGVKLQKKLSKNLLYNKSHTGCSNNVPFRDGWSIMGCFRNQRKTNTLFCIQKISNLSLKTMMEDGVLKNPNFTHREKNFFKHPIWM